MAKSPYVFDPERKFGEDSDRVRSLRNEEAGKRGHGRRSPRLRSDIGCPTRPDSAHYPEQQLEQHGIAEKLQPAGVVGWPAGVHLDAESRPEGEGRGGETAASCELT